MPFSKFAAAPAFQAFDRDTTTNLKLLIHHWYFAKNSSIPKVQVRSPNCIQAFGSWIEIATYGLLRERVNPRISLLPARHGFQAPKFRKNLRILAGMIILHGRHPDHWSKAGDKTCI